MIADCYISRYRFWEICTATIEERLRLYGSKTRCFCPSESKATRIKASLSSPPESNRARSAFLTVFSPYSLCQARESDEVEDEKKGEKGDRLLFCKKKDILNLRTGQQKKGPVPFFLAVLLPFWHSIG